MEFGLALNSTPVYAPSGYNGRSAHLDMSSLITHIRSDSKMVLDVNGNMDLNGTLAYAIFARAGSPTTLVIVTADMLMIARNKLSQHIVKYNFYCLCAEFGIHIHPRSNDTISFDDWKNNPCSPAFNEAAGKLWSYLISNPSRLQEMISGANSYITLFIYNSLHRHHNDSHNGYTTQSTEEGHPSYRLRDVSGSMREEFDKFTGMDNALHDMWHDVTDQQMVEVANAITGASLVGIKGPITYAGTIHGPHGEIVYFHNIMNLSSAATDRWPVNNLGLASTHVALGFVEYIFSSIRTKLTTIRSPHLNTVLPGTTPAEQAKVLADNEALEANHEAQLRREYNSFPDLKPVIQNVREILNQPGLPRDVIIALRGVLMPLTGFTAGFLLAYEGKNGFDRIVKSKAFIEASRQSSIESDKAVGSMVGEYLASKLADPIKISEMAAEMIKGISSALHAAVDHPFEIAGDDDEDDDGNEGGSSTDDSSSSHSIPANHDDDEDLSEMGKNIAPKQNFGSGILGGESLKSTPAISIAMSSPTASTKAVIDTSARNKVADEGKKSFFASETSSGVVDYRKAEADADEKDEMPTIFGEYDSEDDNSDESEYEEEEIEITINPTIDTSSAVKDLIDITDAILD